LHSMAIRKASGCSGKSQANTTTGRWASKNLQDYWKLEQHRPGEQTFTHYPTLTRFSPPVCCAWNAGFPTRRTDLAAAASKRTRIMRRRAKGNECIACHMPKFEQTIADVNIRAHTFKFTMAATTCGACHADKPVGWAGSVLKTWPNFSPWRAAR
jgi:hypothetical protein